MQVFFFPRGLQLYSSFEEIILDFLKFQIILNMFKSGENGVPYSHVPINMLQQFSVYVHRVSPLRKF